MILLVTVMLALMAVKIFIWDYSFESLVPQKSFRVNLKMSFTGNGEDLVARTFLPKNDSHQTITSELITAPGLNFSRISTPHFERGDWSQYNAEGPYTIDVRYSAQIKAVEYELPANSEIPSTYPDYLAQYLAPTEVVQVNDPLIVETLREIVGETRMLLPALQRIYEYVADLGSKPFKGTTDALTALKLGEASCNGKSRLFIALTRQLGIPSRLVGGLILTPGTKRTSHQWTELYIGGYWVPFDMLNRHFASLPDNYLSLYTGDEALFRHSRNIGFDYSFTIRKSNVTNARLAGFLDTREWNFYQVFEGLLKRGMSLEILQFLLVIPFGVLFVVVFKNVIGLKTFGTFLPALMAMAVQETGIGAGLFAFVIVLSITVLLRYPLEALGLLHTPKLAVMMVVVIFSLILVSSLSQLWEIEGFSALNSAALFPIAILTITSERIALNISEEGLRSTLATLIQTFIVIVVAYIVMSSVALQTLVIAFPELLLGVIVLNLWMGSWVGIRLVEFYRFRSIIFKGGRDGAAR